MTLSTAFNMARNAPTFERHNKLREVSFLVPHEVARLNRKAPDFHLEDLGPVSDGEILWDLRKGGTPLDARTETRVFLYFPNGSSKAAAVFLAVNSELIYTKKAMRKSTDADHRGLTNTTNAICLIKAFRDTHQKWKRSHPSPADRMKEVGQLPLICVFQESVFGCAYYPRFGHNGPTVMAMIPLDVTDLSSKTWKV